MAIVFADIQGIGAGQLPGVTEFMARRVLAYARTIAPCLSTIQGPEREDAIAILQGVALELVSRGSRLIASQSVGPASVAYRDVASVFGADDRAALRALCGSGTVGALPQGSFPTERPVSRLWPETYG